MIDLGSFLASHKSKIFLAMRGAAAPFNSSNRRGTFPFLQPPDVPFGYGTAPKSHHYFKQHFSNKKSVGGKNKAFFSPFEATKRGVKRSYKGVYIW
jgi:hypothetical protein